MKTLKSNFNRNIAQKMARGIVASLTTGLLVASPMAIDQASAQPRYNNDNYNSPIRVLLNGQVVDVGNVDPIVENGRVLVPLRGVLEALGAQVNYNPGTGAINARRGRTDVNLQVGSTQAEVNGRTSYLDVPARATQGRTLVPLRFVSEALGASVYWNNNQQTVSITDDNRGPNRPGNGDWNNGPGNNDQQIVLRGRVTGDVGNNQRFSITTREGRVVRVRARDGEPTNLNIGDRVEIRGQFNANNVFIAESVDITNDR